MGVPRELSEQGLSGGEQKGVAKQSGSLVTRRDGGTGLFGHDYLDIMDSILWEGKQKESDTPLSGVQGAEGESGRSLAFVSINMRDLPSYTA
jgi:hypothetical protein